jgi:hypothetical protein
LDLNDAVVAIDMANNQLQEIHKLYRALLTAEATEQTQVEADDVFNGMDFSYSNHQFDFLIMIRPPRSNRERQKCPSTF